MRCSVQVVLKAIANNSDSWLRLSPYGPSYSTSYARDMREKLSMRRLLTDRLSNIVRIALSLTFVSGWSPPIIGVLFVPSSARARLSPTSRNRVVYQNLIGTIFRLFIMRTCCIQRVLIPSSSPSTSSWASSTQPNVPYRLSQQQLRIGSGFNSQWYVLFLLSFI